MSKLSCMYLRLSKEDGDTTESNSIASQRQIIESFAKNNDITTASEYVDDGYYVIIMTAVKSIIKSRVLLLLQKNKTLKNSNLCVV